MTPAYVISLMALALIGGPLMAQPIDTMPDTWAATDALGRSLLTAPKVPAPRAGKAVGIFYFLWLDLKYGPYDISKALAKDPNAMMNADIPVWGPQSSFHQWGESIYGYYLNTDTWVLRRHATMLSDAGVDVVIFDVTNNLTYPESWKALAETWTQMRKEGLATPQIAFLCPFGDPTPSLNQLWEQLYQPGLYRDLWYLWKGKPLIMADPAFVTSSQKEFFTFRKPMPSYFDGPSGPDQWSWLEIYPQHMFKNSQGEREMMSVGASQNGTDGKVGSMRDGDRVYGRTWHNGARDTRPGAVNMGFNLAEQFEHAIKEDPDFIFVTGWNEWMALRLPEFLGFQKPVIFVDAFNHEYSSDIEPMVGGHTDSYYYQMVNYIRRFKGARAVPKAGREVSIGRNTPWSAWQKVLPTYLDTINETLPRDHDGIGTELHYTDKSGRNDIRVAKVARDAKNLVFYVQTTSDITPRTGPRWMQLFISTGSGPAWEGFQYAVNRVSPGSKAVLEVCLGGWKWNKLADVDYKLQGNQLMVSIPRKILGLFGKPVNLQFKWADNCLKDGDILTAWTSGDTAPTGRARYIYQQ